MLLCVLAGRERSFFRLIKSAMLIEPFALNGPTGNTWTKVSFNTRFVIGISYLGDSQQIEGIYIHIVEPYPRDVLTP